MFRAGISNVEVARLAGYDLQTPSALDSELLPCVSSSSVQPSGALPAT
jgi:hypothetical protein